MRAGQDDLARAARNLASRVPEPLGALARLAYDYRWSWMPGGPELFRAVDPHRWRLCGENPVRLLQEASPDALARAAADADLVARATALEDAIAAERAAPAAADGLSAERPGADRKSVV